jgi:hypothetical protein
MRVALTISISAVLLLAVGTISAAEGIPENDALFKLLQHENMDVRIAALRELQTSLDPRMPEALLILLRDDGNSIRRLAARGIGSRYWQIPEERIPDFVQALKANANTEWEDEKEMVRRAVSLLTRTYDSSEVSRSPNGRWVLYERYNLPCLIDTSTGSEELLGWKPEDRVRISSYLLNGGDNGVSIWHPEKEMVAMSAAVSRRQATMIAWVHGKGFKRLEHSNVFKALGANEDRVNGAGGFFVEYKGWSDDQIRISCYFVVLESLEGLKNKGDFVEGEIQAELLWNPVSDEITKVSMKVE